MSVTNAHRNETVTIDTVVVLRAVAVSNVNEDLLQKQLIELNNHTLVNIPVAEVGEVLQVELGLVLKKIIRLVYCTILIICLSNLHCGQYLRIGFGVA